MLLCLVLIAIFAPWLGTVDPTALAPAKRTRLPSADYWFGTDLLGRDIYSRVLYGARVSLTVGLSVAVLSSIAGLAIGLVSGFVRWADRGVWVGLFEALARSGGPALQLMIDSSAVKAHRSAAGGKGGRKIRRSAVLAAAEPPKFTPLQTNTAVPWRS